MSNETLIQAKEAMNHLYSLPPILSMNVQIEWLVNGLIPRGAVVLLAGTSGVGKSTFALAMGGAVATGEKFLDRETRKSEVLYVDSENPPYVVRERFVRLGIDDDGLKVWGGWVNPPPQGPEDINVKEWARDTKGLIIYDSLISFIGNGSEQDAGDMRKYMDHYRWLANAGASVLVLHHVGKNEGSSYRGSSDIPASVDQHYKLEKVGNGYQLSSLRLKAEKTRIAEVSTIHFGLDADGVFRTKTTKGVAGDAAERADAETDESIIRSIIQIQPGINQGQLIRSATVRGLSRSRVMSILKDSNAANWEARRAGAKNSKLFYPVGSLPIAA